ncbi:MAG: extracellular solute-binding protein [Isosphaeraceae bacterium]
MPSKTLPPTGPAVELTFAYGSEKKGWIEEVTKAFNTAEVKLESGERIEVKTKAAGSGEIVDELLKGTLKAHLISPASAAFVVIGNGRSREADQGDLVGPTRELVRSPLVLAVWPDLADALGWRERPPSWREVFDAARSPEKWAGLNARKPGPGPFRLGHTRPDDSNSGLHALFLMAYAANNKFDASPTRGELLQPALGDYLREVEAAVVKPLETSTGFLAKSMLEAGPAKMTAAIVYENLVIEANRGESGEAGPLKLVAVYPAEGTFQTEHPVGVVRRPWVTPLHEKAAETYIAYLLAAAQQEKAKAHGFRPADASLPLDDLLKPEYGVSAVTPSTLPTPSAPTISTLRRIWQERFAAPSVAGAPAAR